MENVSSYCEAFNQKIGHLVLDDCPFSNPDGVSETDINTTWVCEEIVHTEAPDLVVNRNAYSGEESNLIKDSQALDDVGKVHPISVEKQFANAGNLVPTVLENCVSAFEIDPDHPLPGSHV